jgi:hypothetical protein
MRDVRHNHMNKSLQLTIVYEPTYTFGSADNVRDYPHENNLSHSNKPLSAHGVLLNGNPLVVFGASGLSRIYENSLIELNDLCFLAIDCHVVCFRKDPYEFMWVLQTDSISCFGIYYQPVYDALISHGELEIARFNSKGELLWSSSGEDIFTQGFKLESDFVSAIDFNDKQYRFDYTSGRVYV